MRDKYMIPLNYHFDIKPWEIDRLTVSQFLAYCRAVDEMNS